jgi:outer membrane protein, heavy metal efflux system
MKLSRRLFSFIIVMILVNSVYADSYKDALNKLQTDSRPWFIDQQLKDDYGQQQVIAPTTVSLPESLQLLQVYQENRSRRLDHVVKNIDDRLLSASSIKIQHLAKTGNVDDLLKNQFKLLDLINIAYAKNPAIGSASAAWMAALNRYPQAAYLDGILRQYNSFTKTLNLLTGGMQNQRQIINAEFPFPGVTSLRGDIVQTDVQLAEMDYAITLRDVLANVKKAFADLIFIGRAISITQDNQELLEQMLSVVSQKFEAGRTSYNDVIRTRIELAELSNALITLRNQRHTIQTKINALIDRTPNAPLGKPVETKYEYPQINLKSLYSLAKQYGQEIRQAQLKEQRTRLMIDLAVKMNRPDSTTGASYFQNRSALLSGSITDQPSFNPAPAQPLRPWFGQRESFIAEMRNRRQSLSEKVNDVINQTFSLVKTIHFELDSAKRESELYRTTLIPEARQSLAITEKDYQAAQVDYLDYMDAQRTWLAFNLEAYRSQKDERIASAELERVIGVSLTSHTIEQK